jgi:hypothetical protein
MFFGSAADMKAPTSTSNQVDFYPDLGYVLVALGNRASGSQEIANRVRAVIAASPKSSEPVGNSANSK